MRGKIILINGASSSGKTVIAMKLLGLLGRGYKYVAIDNFLSKASPPTNVGETVSTFYKEIRDLSDSGSGVIVDHVLEKIGWVKEWVEMFSQYPTLVVGLKCSTKELERREKLRGDRKLGLAKLQQKIVHKYIGYHVLLETDKMNIEECARNIKGHLDKNEIGYGRAFTLKTWKSFVVKKSEPT